MTLDNMQCRLAARPVGLPKPTDWTFTEEPVPSPADGELLVEVEYLSIDPAMRAWMNAGRSYVPPVEIGEVMRAAGIARVVESRNPDFAVGDDVYGVFGVQRYAVSDGRGVTQGRHRARAGSGTPRRARHQRPDRLFRPARHRQARSRVRPSSSPVRPGRWAASRGRSRRSRAAGWSGSPAGRRSVAGSSTSSGSTPPSTTSRRSCAQAEERRPERGRRVLRQRRRRDPRGGAGPARARRARRAVRRHLAVQRHRPPAADRRTTCSCSSRGRR